MKLSEAKEIVGRYGEVLENNLNKYNSVIPESLLPSTIEKIKYSLLAIYFHSGASAEEKKGLGSLYVMLSSFVKDEDAKIWSEEFGKEDGKRFTSAEFGKVAKFSAENAGSLLKEWREQIRECKIFPPEMDEEDRKSQMRKIMTQRQLESEEKGKFFWDKWGKLFIGVILGSLATLFLLGKY